MFLLPDIVYTVSWKINIGIIHKENATL